MAFLPQTAHGLLIIAALDRAHEDLGTFLPLSSPLLWLKARRMALEGGYNNNNPGPRTIFGYPIHWKD